MERFDLKMLNDVEVKRTGLKSQIGLQLWKTWMVVVVWWRILKIIRSKEAGKFVVVAELKPNKWS